MTSERAARFSPMRVWFGALFTGAIALLSWAIRSPLTQSRPGTVILAVGLAAIVATVAVTSHRRGRTDLAVGMVGGYGVLTLISGGVCTITFDESRLEFLAAGLFGYVLFLIVTLVIAAVVVAARRAR